MIPAAPRSTPAVLAVLWVLATLLSSPLTAAPAPGWKKVDVPATGSYFWRYVPTTLDASRPAPLVLFFHGSGGSPEGYKDFVLEAVEAAGCIVALPKSSSNLGWGTETDDRTVDETLRLVRQELTIDDRRMALAGHSAGGAYAYLLTYADRRYSAVFTLSAPWFNVASLADPAYQAPIHMYYGTTDPNFTGGAYAKLKAQWNRLGVPWEDDVQAGFGHNTWPVASMVNGFLFVVSKSRPDPISPCVPGEANLCLSRGRFKVEIAWDANGSSGHGHVVPGASADSGLFWFFSPDNWELLVKVLDGCGLNDRYWVYAAATTDVHYVLTVTDTANGSFKRYENPAGKPSAATTDSGAFRTCP